MATINQLFCSSVSGLSATALLSSLVASSDFQCMFSTTRKWNRKSEFPPEFSEFKFFGILVANLGYQKTEHFLLEKQKKMFHWY